MKDFKQHIGFNEMSKELEKAAQAGDSEEFDLALRRDLVKAKTHFNSGDSEKYNVKTQKDAKINTGNEKHIYPFLSVTILDNESNPREVIIAFPNEENPAGVERFEYYIDGELKQTRTKDSGMISTGPSYHATAIRELLLKKRKGGAKKNLIDPETVDLDTLRAIIKRREGENVAVPAATEA